MQYGSPKSVGNIVNVAINSIELRLDLLLLPAVYVGIVSLPTYLEKTKIEVSQAFVDMQKADCALSNVLIRARCPY